MKLGIAGYGYVGKAHELLLYDYYEKILIRDPAKGHYADLNYADAIIVCVSTPSRPDGGCEMANIFDVIECSPEVPILIKSTLSVEGWKSLVDAYPDRDITYSPEFLRANTWSDDIKNCKHWYLGGKGSNFWAEQLIRVLGTPTITVRDPADLVAAKALRNSFLALKVSFFNQVHDFAKAHELNFDTVAEVIGADERIGSSHTQVTEERGYGGHCFPKDVKAVIKSGQAYNARLTLLEEADAYNNKIRKS